MDKRDRLERIATGSLGIFNMIFTNIVNDDPVIIIHRLTGMLTKSNALTGSDKAISVVKDALKKRKLVHLIIDVKDYIFNDLEAHRIWALNFKENEIITGNVAKVALVGNDVPKFQAEKEYMESETLRFFTDREIALVWLTNA